jgi:predicted SnoaL-like aldol condensation-catalyzing enzyme
MTLATIAHAALNGIFREKNPDVVGRFFAEPFVQHDVTLADGLRGLGEYAREVAASRADLTIHRTIEDGDFVLLHSMYRGLPRSPGPVIAFDLFRFRSGKIGVFRITGTNRGRALGAASVSDFFIIPFRHAASRTVNLDHVRSLKGGFLEGRLSTRATEERTLLKFRVGVQPDFRWCTAYLA